MFCTQTSLWYDPRSASPADLLCQEERMIFEKPLHIALIACSVKRTPECYYLIMCNYVPRNEFFRESVLSGIFAYPSPDLSSGLMAGAEGRLAPFAVTILASGYDNGPAGGPVAGFPQAPGVLLP